MTDDRHAQAMEIARRYSRAPQWERLRDAILDLCATLDEAHAHDQQVWARRIDDALAERDAFRRNATLAVSRENDRLREALLLHRTIVEPPNQWRDDEDPYCWCAFNVGMELPSGSHSAACRQSKAALGLPEAS
jgi:hypothetical protein